MSCDREKTSPTRVTPSSQDEDSSESDQEETSPTREMSPLQSEASLDLECIENSDVCDSESENSSDSESDSEPDSEMEIISFSKAVSVCTCGATGAGRVSHHRNCPCNPRNVTLQGTSSSGPAYTVTGPLPTVEWKDLALNRLSSLAGVSAINKIRSPDPLKPVPCREIAPHIRDVVCGDGHCFFRALSKELTGTEDNHLLIRRAITSFMVIPENEVILARYCNVESMARHVSQKQIDKDGWATEVEIHVIPALIQPLLTACDQILSSHVENMKRQVRTPAHCYINALGSSPHDEYPKETEIGEDKTLGLNTVKELWLPSMSLRWSNSPRVHSSRIS